MNLIAVDDERGALESLKTAIEQAVPGQSPICFKNASKAVEYASGNPVDVAFLDVEMPGMDGISLAKQLKELQPGINIIFVTGYSKYAEDAFSVRASGYLHKPVLGEEVKAELTDLRYPLEKPEKGLYIQTFGNFEVYMDGQILRFGRSKAKELLAYLISRGGTGCTNREIIAALWGEALTGYSVQSNYRNAVANLTAVLRSIGEEDLLIRSRGLLAVDAKRVNCDLFRFQRGDARAVNSYGGEFMAQYSWAGWRIFREPHDKQKKP